MPLGPCPLRPAFRSLGAEPDQPPMKVIPWQPNQSPQTAVAARNGHDRYLALAGTGNRPESATESATAA